jgi:hypothetical protein
VPIDLNFKVLRAGDFRSSRQERRLSLQMDMVAEAFLHMPDGGRQYIGLLEFYGGELGISVFSQGMLLKGKIDKFEFKSAYASTVYGISRYETTTFLINMVLYGTCLVINEDFFDLDLVRVPDRWGYFNMQDLYLDYYDNYIAMGITPEFKRYNATDWEVNNETWPYNKTKAASDVMTYWLR